MNIVVVIGIFSKIYAQLPTLHPCTEQVYTCRLIAFQGVYPAISPSELLWPCSKAEESLKLLCVLESLSLISTPQHQRTWQRSVKAIAVAGDGV
jgi:hypothetical protein